MKFQSSKLPLSATNITTISHSGVTSILRINKIIHYYKGYYYCVVKNELGEVNSSMAQLNVYGMYYSCAVQQEIVIETNWLA